ncbi:myosin-9 [Cylas formicarius]|uniref:myosin-9 n=1 Tax=Cylas formicarius TaxID=197179 RepID=UPI0029583220|nr:myosin-9 [Cylas formicarius]
MKFKQNFTVSERNLIQKVEREINKKDLELRAGKKIPSNPLIQKNLTFLQGYDQIFGTPQYFGHSGARFRGSLRNHKSFDLVRDLRLDQAEFIKSQVKQRSKLTKHHRLNEATTNRSSAGYLFETDAVGDHQSESENKESTQTSKMAEESEDVEQDLAVAEEKGEEERFETEPEKMDDDFLDQEEEFDDIPEEDEEEDDDLQEVEKMIQEASDQLEKVAEEGQKVIEKLAGEEEQLELVTETLVEKPEGDESVFKFDAATDAAVLRELEEAEKQAKVTAKVIADLKERVGELLEKEEMTETEARELEAKNMELKKQMMLFEEKTKRMQALLTQTNLFDKMVPIKPPLQVKHAEDVLPKMLVCGYGEDLMPKIVVCDDKKRSKSKSPCTARSVSPIGRQMIDSYHMLEDKPKFDRKNVLNRDETLGCLQRQVCVLRTEMAAVHQVNAAFTENLQMCPNPECPKNSRPGSPAKKSCGPGRGVCPAEVQNRLKEYSHTTTQLEKQLGDIEIEVKGIQEELLEVQKEREHLEHHRKKMCVPPSCRHIPCMPATPRLTCGGEDQKYKELKEQYNRLQEDFRAKLTEVAGLRADNEKLKDQTKAAEDARKALEDKVKELEKRLKELRGDLGVKGSGTREQIVELEQQLKVFKEMYRQAQDELEELRALAEDVQGQLGSYRNKYLEAIQTVEEQRRQIDIMRLENDRVSEQVNLEIQRVKNQFQEKLQELAPLPDILKSTQTKLQEAQQLHLLAERNNEALSKELQLYKDKLQALNDEMDTRVGDGSEALSQKEQMALKFKELVERERGLRDENENLISEKERLKEVADENERVANEKLHEIAQLESQLENVREESARQVSRIKDRCEIVRRSMQNQISDLEQQLAQTKACVRAAEKDRDEVRRKMHVQIVNLGQNFEDAQMRIRNLQGHVNFLKNAYCSPGDATRTADPDPCGCPAEY